MKNYLKTLMLLFTLAGCTPINSGLYLKPGEQFRLGGNQRGAFTVKVKNTGKAPVTISEQPKRGSSVELGVFKPGDSQTVSFSRGSAALVTNASKKSAKLDLHITGNTNLNMGYDGNR